MLLKLNGGLGTSMGLEKAKSLLVVKDDLTFLDIIARQALQQPRAAGADEQFQHPRGQSLPCCSVTRACRADIPLDFVQHSFPKIAQADLRPVAWPANRDLEWYPPGHGDIYPALLTSGMLDALLVAGLPLRLCLQRG